MTIQQLKSSPVSAETISGLHFVQSSACLFNLVTALVAAQFSPLIEVPARARYLMQCSTVGENMTAIH